MPRNCVDKGAPQNKNRNDMYSVPQEELDTFQESYDNLSSETLYNLKIKNKLPEANETEHFNNMNTALISPKEYMSSKTVYWSTALICYINCR